MPAPLSHKEGNARADYQICDCHDDQTICALDDLLQFTLQYPRYDIPHTVFDQQAHGTVDQTGGKLLPRCTAKQHDGDEQKKKCESHCHRRKKAIVAHDREGHREHGYNAGPRQRVLYPTLAKVSIFHHDKTDPLGQADPVAIHIPAPEFFIHCRTAPSIPAMRCEWLYSTVG